jgi:hypothetical protein
MNRRTFMKTLPAVAVLAGAAASAAEDTNAVAQPRLQPMALPKPETEGGKSVLAALQERRTNRNVGAEPLPPQTLSNLLWAAFGVNRASGNFGKPGRTAASASNSASLAKSVGEFIWLGEPS